MLQLGSGDRDQRAVQAVLPVYSKKIANPNVVESEVCVVLCVRVKACVALNLYLSTNQLQTQYTR